MQAAAVVMITLAHCVLLRAKKLIPFSGQPPVLRVTVLREARVGSTRGRTL